MTRPEPIRTGDKFRAPGNGDIYEVIRCLPGGKLDLFIRAKCRFTMRQHKEIKQWERIS